MSAPQSRQTYLVQSALQAALMPADEVRKIRPPVPQQLEPNRFGMVSAIPTIQDVLYLNRRAPAFRSWVSGAPVMLTNKEGGGFSGTDRNMTTSIAV